MIKGLKSFVSTMLLVYFTKLASMFLHEWTHSTIAWLYGLKQNPFAIHYGTPPLFADVYAVDDGHFYQNLFGDHQGLTAAMIAVGGPSMNATLALGGFFLLLRPEIRDKKWLFAALYWFTLNNLGQVYSYIPIRLFSPSGDIGFFLRGVGLSLWALGIPVTLLLAVGFMVLIKTVLPRLFQVWPIRTSLGRHALFALSLALFFLWYGLPALFFYGPHDLRSISYPLSAMAGVAIFWGLRRAVVLRPASSAG